MSREEWRVSLHGGHSGEFCDHAEHTLREILEAAVAADYHTFGVSEHIPRSESRFMYEEELRRGWDVTKIQADFARYTAALPELCAEFADRLIVLRGFEAEVIPTEGYAAQIRGYQEQQLPDGRPAFDYFVGSVHYVDEIQIDGPVENYLKAVEHCGGLEPFVVRYYETVAEMVRALRPDVVGHLDLIRRNLELAGFALSELETPRIRAASDLALEAVKAADAVLDLNTAGWRKGLADPYPAPHLVRRAQEIGVPFCFGDDSHRIGDVGAGIDAARNYLLENGVNTVRVLTREGDPLTGQVVARAVSLT
jgi:histidinol-phosphatase (PHP family)